MPEQPSRLADDVAYSVIVPVFNSAASLEQLHNRLVAVMERIGAPFELIFVDDCSTDASWPLLRAIAQDDDRVTALRLAGNVGQGEATLVGLQKSSGEILVTIDDDLQHPPEEIPKLLAALTGDGELDAVYGVPIRRRDPGWRRAASWIFNLALSLILRKPLRLRISGFRAMRRSLVARLASAAWPNPIVSTLLFYVTPRIGCARVEHCDSALAQSRYSLSRLVGLSFDTLRCLSGRRRLWIIAVAAGVGTGLLALATWIVAVAPLDRIASVPLGSLAFVGALISFGLGLTTSAAHLSAVRLRRRPVSAPAVACSIRRRPRAASDSSRMPGQDTP